MNSTIMNYDNDTQSIFMRDFQLDFTVSLVFYGIQWFLFIPTIYINSLVFRMAIRESLSISLELKVVSMIYIVVSVMSLIYMGLIKFAFPVSDTIGGWFCQISDILMPAVMCQQLMLTFTVSVYRYVFIIYRESSTSSARRQRQVTWAIFIIKWIVLLVLATKFVIFTENCLWVKIWTRICEGDLKCQITQDKEVAIVDDVSNKLFYMRTNNNTALYTTFGNVKNETVAYVLQGFCVIVDIISWIIFSNLTEAFLYYKCAQFMKRHDTFMLNGRLASGDAPPSSNTIAIRKRKREICNVIHNMTWVIESFVILSGCTIQLLSLKMDPYLVQSIQDTNGLLFARIIVPFTYLYSENSIKQIILEDGWIRATKSALSFDRFLDIVPFVKNNTSFLQPYERPPKSPAHSENVLHSRGRLHTISNQVVTREFGFECTLAIPSSGKDNKTHNVIQQLDSKNLPNVTLEEITTSF